MEALAFQGRVETLGKKCKNQVQTRTLLPSNRGRWSPNSRYLGSKRGEKESS